MKSIKEVFLPYDEAEIQIQGRILGIRHERTDAVISTDKIYLVVEHNTDKDESTIVVKSYTSEEPVEGNYIGSITTKKGFIKHYYYRVI